MAEAEYKVGMCGLCGGRCAIGAEVKDDHILSVQKLEDHPYLPSEICVRGAALKQFIHHRDRIEYPMKRVVTEEGTKFVRVTWDEAISAIAARLLKTREESGARATVFYAGHPKWFRKVMAELSSAYGTPNFVTESSTCRSATAMAMQLTTGLADMRADTGSSDVYLLWSGNPSGQQGTTAQLARLKKKGTRIIVADPHKTGMTELADLHLQLWPGTDGALALAIGHVLIEEDLTDKDYIGKYTYGFEEYREYVKEFTPERAEKITGVPREQIIQAARILGSGRCSLSMSNCSVTHCINGVQNARAVNMLIALRGGFGVDGGNTTGRLATASLDTFHHVLAKRPDIEHDIADNEFPVWNETINNEGQCIRLADVVLEERPYKIRNIISFGMNTGMWPEAHRIEEALDKVEFSVVTELFFNEACSRADYVLPACAAPERDQVVIGKKNHMLLVRRLIDPGEKLPDVEIMLRLAHALDVHGPFIDQPDYDAYMNYTMRNTGVTLDELKEHPEGIDARKVRPAKAFDPAGDFRTPTGKVEFTSTILAKYPHLPGYDPLPVFRDWRDMVGERDKYPFILVAGPRKPFLFHSRTYRLDWLSGLEPHTMISICSEDADRLGLKEGGRVRLSTPKGSMEYYVMIDEGLKSGVVYVYHDDGAQNVNRLIDGHYYDPISGFPGFRSYICSLESADVPAKPAV